MMSQISFLRHARTTVKVLLYSVLVTGGAASAGFVGTHVYLEYLDSTPTIWSTKARFAYRAAVMNRYLGQPEAAKSNLEIVLESLTQVNELGSVQSTSCQRSHIQHTKVLFLLADVDTQLNRLLDAIKIYSDIVSDAYADKSLRCRAARLKGELQHRLGFTTVAAISLEHAVRIFVPDYHLGKSIYVDKCKIEAKDFEDAILSLSIFRAHEGHHQEALVNLLSLLKLQQETRSNTTRTNCTDAKTMAILAQIAWALGDNTESLAWTERSLRVCGASKTKNLKDCMLCAASNYNTQGLLNLKAGIPDRASFLFTKAIAISEHLNDSVGSLEYSKNLEKVGSYSTHDSI